MNLLKLLEAKNMKKRIEIHHIEGLAELIHSAIFDEEEEQPTFKKPIGTISESLKQKYITWKNENEDFVAEVRFKKEVMEKKVQREMDELFRLRFEELAERKEILWDSIREELKVNDDTSLNFDPRTGIISEWVTHEDLGD
jgi:hypothetical protein